MNPIAEAMIRMEAKLDQLLKQSGQDTKALKTRQAIAFQEYTRCPQCGGEIGWTHLGRCVADTCPCRNGKCDGQKLMNREMLIALSPQDISDYW